MASFAHLHVHTEFSLLDGMSRIKDLVSYTKELGMDSLAITDHGAMFGVIDFYKACKAQGVKPIIGMETYLAAGSMYERERDSYHLLLIAQNVAGYRNLLKIASASQLQGFYYRPRIDKDFLAEHSEGLICTSGCLAAEVPQLLKEGKDESARKMLGWYWDVFGPDRFYMELQDHKIPELHEVNRLLHEIAPYANVPFLATNDVHYVRQTDANPHDVLLCIGTGSLVADTKRLKFSDDSYYMRTPEEMERLFGEVPGAISNTLKVAEMCDLNLDAYYKLDAEDPKDKYKLPLFPVPDGYDAASYLRELCFKGARWRYEDRAETAEVQERLEHELKIIHDMGFDTYFLINWDLCEFARDNDIWWNVRGSGAGSVVAYSLGITNIDPLRNSLIFERFLNPGRVTMPDIDIDYPDDRRMEMIEYCVEKYGEEKVAHIITFGTLGARAAIRDVGRTLDIPLDEVDKIARVIPAVPGKAVTLEKVLEDNAEMRGFYEDKEHPYYRQMIDTAMQLEGISRHASTHAAGILISDIPLDEYTPLHRPTKGNGEVGLGSVSQWPMAVVDDIGLLKVDFLGLRTLTIMRKACELVERYHGVKYDLDSIPYRHIEGDDAYNESLDAAFKLLWRGETSGVFQVEGDGMTRMLTEMKPSTFEHIIAAISLFRPGPIEYIPAFIRRMHGEEDVSYHHDLLEPILSETYGIIVYQEQIMHIAAQLFDYGLGDADLMRRAVAKKKEKELKKHREIFRKNGPEHDVLEETADKIFNDIEFFARYGFNKSHAADYAVLTVQTAFLKAHYPHEYMTALLTIERGNSDKVRSYIKDCNRQGIPVLPPDVNESEDDFIIIDAADETRSIRYGLSAIKNVGEGAVLSILDARGDERFADIGDFCDRADLRSVGKRAVESLIKVGAMDQFAETRMHLLDSIDRIMSVSSKTHQAAEIGQMSLFGEATGVELLSSTDSILVTDPQATNSQRDMREWERDLMGMSVSEHPIQAIIDQVGKVITKHIHEITEADHEKAVTMVGEVTSFRPHTAKSGKQMAFAEIEDNYNDRLQIVIWPSTWDKTQDLWETGRVLLLRGKLDTSRNEPQLLCDEATTNFEMYIAVEELEQPTLVWQEETEEVVEPYVEDTPPPPPYNEPYHDDAIMYDEPPYEEVLPSAANGGDSMPQQEPAPDAAPNGRANNGDEIIPDPPVLDEDAAPPPPEAQTGRHVLISLQRSHDSEHDKRRLQHIHGTLHSQPGEDKFTIQFLGGEKPIKIEFPNELTNYDVIYDKLADTLGPEENIQII